MLRARTAERSFSSGGRLALVRQSLCGRYQLSAIYTKRRLRLTLFLMSYLHGSKLDARNNQYWFLDQIHAFLDRSVSNILIVDQHPPGIGEAYSRLFEEADLMSIEDVNECSIAARGIYDRVDEEGFTYLTVNLTARPETLWSRVTNRPSGPRLTRREVTRVAYLFQEIVFSGNTLFLNSEILGIQEEVALVRSWLESLQPFKDPSS